MTTTTDLLSHAMFLKLVHQPVIAYLLLSTESQLRRKMEAEASKVAD